MDIANTVVIGCFFLAFIFNVAVFPLKLKYILSLRNIVDFILITTGVISFVLDPSEIYFNFFGLAKPLVFVKGLFEMFVDCSVYT